MNLRQSSRAGLIREIVKLRRECHKLINDHLGLVADLLEARAEPKPLPPTAGNVVRLYPK